MAIILSSAILLFRSYEGEDKLAKEEIPEVIMEANVYFASQVDARYDEIKEFEFNDKEEKDLLLKELQDLESYHQQLLIDLLCHLL